MKILDFIKRLRWNGYYRKPDYYGWTYAGKRFGCYEKKNGPAFRKWL